MTEPLACVLRGLHETKMEIGDSVAVIGAGPIGLMFVQVAKLSGCNVISVVKRDSQVAAALRAGADHAVQIDKVDDPVKAVRRLTTDNRGCDIVIEAVGRPQAWEWSIDMVRKGGTVNLFGGCANGTKVALDTQRLHYNELTLKATFHHTPETVRKAFALISEKKIKGTDYITGEAPLVAAAARAASHAQSQRRHQDGDHSGPVGPDQLNPCPRHRLTTGHCATQPGATAPGWSALPPEYAIPDVRPFARGGAAVLRAAGDTRTTKTFPSSPGSCPSICTSTSTTSTPTAGSPTIWATKWATSSCR